MNHLESIATRSELTGRERLVQSDRTASRVLDGKAIVITIDRNQLHVLNTVGTFVWQRADGRSLDAIVDEIAEKFEVDHARARADVFAFAEQILATGAACIRGDEK